jgi:hypothetical protein
MQVPGIVTEKRRKGARGAKPHLNGAQPSKENTENVYNHGYIAYTDLTQSKISGKTKQYDD